MVCKQCKVDKPPSEFLWHGKRYRIKVRKCFACGIANMRKYKATQMVGRKPEEFSELQE